MRQNEALLKHLHSLDEDAKEIFAKRCDTSVAYLFQLAYGHRNPSMRLVDLVAMNTSNLIGRESWPIHSEVA